MAANVRATSTPTSTSRTSLRSGTQWRLNPRTVARLKMITRASSQLRSRYRVFCRVIASIQAVSAANAAKIVNSSTVPTRAMRGPVSVASM